MMQMLQMTQQLMQQQQQQMQQPQQQIQQLQQILSQMLRQSQNAAQSSQTFSRQAVAPNNPELIIDALSSSITEFRYEAESDVTLATWYAQYVDLFAQLSSAEHARYASFILPSVPSDIPLATKR